MISLNNISVSFSGKDLFLDISFIINPKDRIGLVGKNGVGKSTMLKIIAGKQQPTSGEMAISDGKTIGYLPQEIAVAGSKSIFDEALSAFDEVIQIEKRIEHINNELSTREDYESDSYLDLINELSDKHERLSLLDSGKLESRVEKVLKGLGFSDDDFSRSLDTFSGGWQMRVELAKLLLLKPNLLLLDEPTNHLDIQSILWLEDYLINYEGAVMMISHDRMFLDNITNRTIEIVFGKTYDYNVPYTKYFELREERYEQQMATYRNQQKYIDQQERFIERFKAKASKAKQAQSRMKQLDKVDRIEADELDERSIGFSFPPAPRAGDVVLKAAHVQKSYDENEIFTDVNLEVVRGEKVSLVGKNGEGKSTFVKLITDKLKHGGELTIGHNVSIGYYAQVQESSLDPKLTVLETIEHAADSEEWAKASRQRNLLGAFLFGEDDVDKRVSVLSGGEKSRLALAKLILKPVNLLILDEPTNHLDIASKEVLKDALQRFDGALILVSHDRDFLKGLTEKTYEFDGGKVKEHLGGIDDFLASHDVSSFREFEAGTGSRTADKKQKSTAKVDNGNREDRKQQEKQLRKAKSQLQKTEDQIAKLEQELEELESRLATLARDPNGDETQELYYKHGDLQKKLNAKMEQWETDHAKVEQLDKQA